MSDDDRARRRRQQRAEAKAGNPQVDPRFVAGVDLLCRTGSREFQIRWSDEDQPTCWIALCRWVTDEHGMPIPGEGRERWDCAAAMNPISAVMRLCDQTITGGYCKHCLRPAGFDEDFGEMPLAEHVCWYQFDPEIPTFRRGCEDGSE